MGGLHAVDKKGQEDIGQRDCRRKRGAADRAYGIVIIVRDGVQCLVQRTEDEMQAPLECLWRNIGQGGAEELEKLPEEGAQRLQEYPAHRVVGLGQSSFDEVDEQNLIKILDLINI